MSDKQKFAQEANPRSDQPELLEKYRKTVKENTQDASKTSRDYKGVIEIEKDGKVKIPYRYRKSSKVIVGKTRKEKFAKNGEHYARKDSYNPDIQNNEVVFWIKGDKEETKEVYKLLGGVVD